MSEEYLKKSYAELLELVHGLREDSEVMRQMIEGMQIANRQIREIMGVPDGENILRWAKGRMRRGLWTTDLPTEAGLYWVFNPLAEMYPAIFGLWVESVNGRLYAWMWEDGSVPIEDLKARHYPRYQWIGPLAKPAPPEEEQDAKGEEQ